MEHRRHEDDGRDIRAAEDRPGHRVPRRRPPACRGDAAIPALPGAATVGHQTLGDARDAHFLARRRSRGDGEQIARQTTGLRPALLSNPLDRRPPGGGQHRRQREDRQQHQERMNREQQHNRHAESQNPTARGKQRHVHVVEHEDLIAQNRQSVQIVRPFLVRQRGHRRLQPRNVRLEGDGHPVAETTLEASADRAQQPRPGGGQAQRDARDVHEHQIDAAVPRAPASPTTAPAARRAMRPAATARTRRTSGSARGGSRACTVATSTTKPAAAVCRRRDCRCVGRQARTS